MVSILHFCYRYLTVYETFPPPYTRNILFGMNTWWMNALFSFGKNKSGVQILSNLLESNSKISSFPDVQVVKRASTQLKWSMMLTVKSCKEIELGIVWSMNVGCRYIHVKKAKEEYWIPYVLSSCTLLICTTTIAYPPSHRDDFWIRQIYKLHPYKSFMLKTEAILCLKWAGLSWPYSDYIDLPMTKSSVLRYSRIVKFKAKIYRILYY